MKLPLRIALTFSFLWLFFALPGLAVGVRAGQVISAEATIYFNEREISLSTPSVTVQRVYGLNLYATDLSAKILEGDTFYSPHHLANIGNDTNSFSMALIDTTDSFSSTLVVDENKDSAHTSTEVTPVPTDVLIAEDAIYYFFVALKAPDDIGKPFGQEKKGQTTFRTQAPVDDGGAYMGANGSLYGGPDAGFSTIEVVAKKKGQKPPTIIKIEINGRPRVNGDVIPASCEVFATFGEEISGSIDKVRFTIVSYKVKAQGIGSSLKAEIGSAGVYFDQSAVTYRYVPPGGLPPGAYSFTVQAWDIDGLTTSETIAPLYVMEPDKVELMSNDIGASGPASPLKGISAMIAYELSVDTTVTLYLFDIRGTTVWKRIYTAGFEGGKAGYNEVAFNGFSDFGGALGNGIYILRIVGGGKVIGTGKVMVLDDK